MVLKKSLERPDVLENFENFEVLLDALKYSHLTGCFHQLKNLDVLESFIKDMRFLEDVSVEGFLNIRQAGKRRFLKMSPQPSWIVYTNLCQKCSITFLWTF